MFLMYASVKYRTGVSIIQLLFALFKNDIELYRARKIT